MSLSNSKQKLIRSLESKKGRYKNGAFLVEGVKLVDELLESNIETLEVFATTDWIQNHPDIGQIQEVSERELKSISLLTTPNQVLALAKMPQEVPPKQSGIILLLDRIQDPGNLGTIIRTAAWFGVKEVWCTRGSVDPFNPKVVQATMGGLFQLQVHVVDDELITDKMRMPLIALDMKGENMFEAELPSEAVFVLGNEGAGLSDDLRDRVDRTIMIPGKGNMESLNVGMSAGILISELMRRSLL